MSASYEQLKEDYEKAKAIVDGLRAEVERLEAQLAVAQLEIDRLKQ